MTRRWAPLRVPADYDALHEPDGGFVLAGKSIRLHCESALRHGARVQAAETVLAMARDSVGRRGRHQRGHLPCRAPHRDCWQLGKRAVARSADAAASDAAGAVLGLAGRTRSFALEAFPCWAAQLDGCDGLFYGFPMLPAGMGGQLGLKVAHHTRGSPAEPGKVAPIDAAEFVPIRDALKAVFASDLGPVVATEACMYTSTTDGHLSWTSIRRAIA